MFTMYTLPSCMQCKATARKFEKVGASYEVVDLSDNDEARNAVRDMGYAGAPVVVAPSGEHWSGFRPERIDEEVSAALSERAV